MPVSILDIVIATPILIFLVSGFRKGFVEEFLGLIGQIMAIFLAFTFMSSAATKIQDYLGIETAWVPFFAFVGIYIVSIIAVKLIIKLIESVLKIANLSVINLIFGGIFSGLKGAIIVSTILVVLSIIGQPTQKYTQESLLYPYVVPVAPITYNFVSRLIPGVGEFQDQVGEYFKEMDIIKILLGDDSSSDQDVEAP